MPDKPRKPANRTTQKTAAYKPGWWVWVVVAVVAVGALVVGYRRIGQTPSKGSGSSAIHEPALPKNGFTWKYQAYALKSGKPSYLAHGSHVTVVMLMASWCLYCAYVDKYVWPTILNNPGLHLDIVDVSDYNGIGNPGPEQPAFSGKDHVGHKVGVTGMRSVMSQYIKRFHLNRTNVSVFVDPTGISYWSVQYFPTILILNSHGQLVERISGGVTLPKAQTILQSVLKSQ